jgi:hypothetical protein
MQLTALTSFTVSTPTFTFTSSIVCSSGGGGSGPRQQQQASNNVTIIDQQHMSVTHHSSASRDISKCIPQGGAANHSSPQ